MYPGFDYFSKMFFVYQNKSMGNFNEFIQHQFPHEFLLSKQRLAFDENFHLTLLNPYKIRKWIKIFIVNKIQIL
jgi:hypothetical protein